MQNEINKSKDKIQEILEKWHKSSADHLNYTDDLNLVSASVNILL